MVIQNQVSVPSSGADANTGKSTGAGGKLDALANESTFLQLLVSQIKNQDPLNPTDGTQFLSQLAQLSQLEQLVAIRNNLDSAAQSAPSTDNETAGTSAAN